MNKKPYLRPLVNKKKESKDYIIKFIVFMSIYAFILLAIVLYLI